MEAAYRAGLKYVVATDDEEIARAAHVASEKYDPDWSIFMRERAADDEPDIAWVTKALAAYPEADPFMILRPTSPFRSQKTISRALATWRQFADWADSMRAVTSARQTPAKMWRVGAWDQAMRPVVEGTSADVPWHSSPTQLIPPRFYVQTAGLEIAHRRTVIKLGSIAGQIVAPFLVEGLEALDINDEDDMTMAEAALLPVLTLTR